MIPLLLLLVTVSGVSSGRPCGGVQNKYVCHPSNPRQFLICIGDQQYTMKCPGNLHFSTKTQTCDWPQNADCGRPVKVVTIPPENHRSSERRNQPSYTWRRNKNPYLSRAASKERGEPVNAVAALTGPRHYKNPTNRERNVVDKTGQRHYKNPTNRERNVVDKTGQRHYKNPTNRERNGVDNMSQKKHTYDSRSRGTTKDTRKWSLAHYPWWAAKSATPANIKARMSRRPATPTPTYQSRSPFAPRTNHRIRYNPIKSSVGRPPVNSAAAGNGPRSKFVHKAKPRPPVMNDPAPPTKAPKPKKKPIIRKPGKCDPTTCKLPDCRCIGNDIPGGIPVTQTPMMVMLTFDDSVNIANYDYFEKLFDGRFRNPNGCGAKGTFYVSGDATQYHLVEKLYKNGQEIASHSQSHRSPTTWWAHAGYEGYVHEIEGMRKKLSKKSNIPMEDIRGMRVPFLQVGGDDQYQMLHDYKYLYDTSMVTGHLYRNEKPPIWPFTLDYAPDSKTCSLTPCPTGSYPGLWEVPLIRWYGTNKMACAMPDGCVIGPGRSGTLKYLHENFNRHYTTNRSPLGIFLHASWFRRKNGNFEGLLDFLAELSRMEDVWVVSATQAIDWIRNPKPLSQVNSIDSWKC